MRAYAAAAAACVLYTIFCLVFVVLSESDSPPVADGP